MSSQFLMPSMLQESNAVDAELEGVIPGRRGRIGRPSFGRRQSLSSARPVHRKSFGGADQAPAAPNSLLSYLNPSPTRSAPIKEKNMDQCQVPQLLEAPKIRAPSPPPAKQIEEQEEEVVEEVSEDATLDEHMDILLCSSDDMEEDEKELQPSRQPNRAKAPAQKAFRPLSRRNQLTYGSRSRSIPRNVGSKRRYRCAESTTTPAKGLVELSEGINQRDAVINGGWALLRAPKKARKTPGRNYPNITAMRSMALDEVIGRTGESFSVELQNSLDELMEELQ